MLNSRCSFDRTTSLSEGMRVTRAETATAGGVNVMRRHRCLPKGEILAQVSQCSTLHCTLRRSTRQAYAIPARLVMMSLSANEDWHSTWVKSMVGRVKLAVC